MPRNLYTRKGEPSFNGIDPKTKIFGGYAFGWHKASGQCAGKCGKYSHYSLHRRYKFTQTMEIAERIAEREGPPYYWKEFYRLWCCSEACFKNIAANHLFGLTMPPEAAFPVLGFKNENSK